MIFLQLPETMPVRKQSVKEEGNDGASKPLKVSRLPGKACALEELPAGFMGKMLVYKSGAVKLKLGDILYDVSGHYKHNLTVDLSYKTTISSIFDSFPFLRN